MLSATIVYGILPVWMYHAQVPPPDHAFNPNLPGLTWVDMVFPSFLFAMGAALPFSVGKRLRKGASKLKLALNALWRGVKLTFFAILIQHFYPYMTGGDLHSQLLAIFCFALLFPMYMRLPWEMPQWVRTAVQLGAMVIGATVMLCMSYPINYDLNLHLHTSNIIILILANVSVFATLLFIFTFHSRTLRLVVLALLFGIICHHAAVDVQLHIFHLDASAQQLQPFLRGKKATVLFGIDHDADNDLVESVGRTLDNVDVSQSHRIKAPGINCGLHNLIHSLFGARAGSVGLAPV